MSQDPNSIPNFDEWKRSQAAASGKRPALLWGAARGGRRHQGEDFPGAKGEPVAPDADGEVVFAGPNGNMGNTVTVRHDDGFLSRYGHLNKITTQKGARVAAGDELGELGSTGNAKGPHVHYETFTPENLPINPRTSPYRQPLIGRAKRIAPVQHPDPPVGLKPIPTFDEFVQGTAPPAAATGPMASTVEEPNARVSPPAATPAVATDAVIVPPATAAVTSQPARDIPNRPMPAFANEVQEEKFRQWYGGIAKERGLNPNPDDPRHQYDYRAAFLHDAGPDAQNGHWPSQFKLAGHPNRFVDGKDTITGQPDTRDPAVKAGDSRRRGLPTPKPEDVIVQQAVRNPEKLQRDLAWHYGPSALDDFQTLSNSDKRKMILYASQQAARDEVKKSHGAVLTEDAEYQAKMRARIPGLKNRPATPPAAASAIDKPEFGAEIRSMLGMTPHGLQFAPRYGPQPEPVGMGDVRKFEDTDARQQRAIEQELRRSGPGLPSLRVRLRERGLPDEVVGRVLMRQPGYRETGSVFDTPEERARIQEQTEAQKILTERIIPKGNKLGALAQQWPAFLAHVEDLGGQLAKRIGTGGEANPREGTLAKPDIPFMQDVARYLESRARIHQEVASYQPRDQTLTDVLVRAGVGTLYNVGRIAATVEATGLGLPTVMVGESVIHNSDKDTSTQLKEAAKAYAFAWALTKLPVLAQKGLGKIPGSVGRIVEAHPEAVARTIGGAGFGTAGYVEAKARGASGREQLAETIVGAGTGAGLAGGGLKPIGERVLKPVAEKAVRSQAVPEWVRSRVVGMTEVQPAVAYSDDGRAMSLYGDPKTKGVGGTEIPFEKVNTGPYKDRPIIRLTNEQFDQLGEIVTGKRPAPAPEAKQIGGSSEAPPEAATTAAPPEQSMLSRRARRRQANEERRLANEAARLAKKTPSDESVTAPTELPTAPGLVTTPGGERKRIIRHSDPNIDGGEIVGTAPDGRLKVQNNSGGISLVQDPRRQGNREAAIVRTSSGPPETAAPSGATPTELAPPDKATPPAAPTEVETVDAKGDALRKVADAYKSGERMPFHEVAAAHLLVDAARQAGATQDEIDEAATPLERRRPTPQPATITIGTAGGTLDQQAHDAAHSPTNDLPTPSDAQHEAGNYKKGHIKVAGMDLSVENPEGSERSGVDSNGKPWKIKMASHYGYVRRTEGADGEHVDAYIRPGIETDYSGPVFVVNQTKGNGQFDEHKAMIGWPSEAEAKAAYLSHYTKGWDRIHSVASFQSPEQFKSWLNSGDTTAPATRHATPLAHAVELAKAGKATADVVKTLRADYSLGEQEARNLDERARKSLGPKTKTPQVPPPTQTTVRTPKEVIEAAGYKYLGEQQRPKGKPSGFMFNVGDHTLMMDGEITPESVAAYVAQHKAKKAPVAPATSPESLPEGRSPAQAGESLAPTGKEEENGARGQQATQQRRPEPIPEVRESRTPKSPPVVGKANRVKIPGTDRAYQARYAVREADDVVPSHNPFNFQAEVGYHYQNDRRYDREQQYQTQVIARSKSGGAEAFDPAYVVNNSPTAESGPPIIDADGNVLGGNSRSMIIKRVYGGDDRAAERSYRDALIEQASIFGVDPAKIREMRQPILVREIDDEQLMGNAAIQKAITELNVTSTTPLTQDEQSAAAAGQISEEAAQFITDMIEAEGDDATIAAVMDRKGAAIVNRLIEDGIFSAGDRNRLLKDGKPTPEAKTRVESLLVGSIYRDLAQMQATPPGVRRNIERIVVPMRRVAGTDWDISQDVKNAIDAVNEAKATGLGQNFEMLRGQQSMVREPFTDREIDLAKILVMGPMKTAKRFRGYANDFNEAEMGQSLFGAPPSQADSAEFHLGERAAQGAQAHRSEQLGFTQEGLVAQEAPQTAPRFESPIVKQASGLVQRVFGSTSSGRPLLDVIRERGGPDIRTIADALEKNAARLSEGEGQNFARALDKLATLRATHTPISDFLAQGSFFGKELTDEQEWLLVAMDAPARRATKFITNYVNRLAGKPITREDIERANEPEPDRQSALFHKSRIATMRELAHPDVKTESLLGNLAQANRNQTFYANPHTIELQRRVNQSITGQYSDPSDGMYIDRAVLELYVGRLRRVAKTYPDRRKEIGALITELTTASKESLRSGGAGGVAIIGIFPGDAPLKLRQVIQHERSHEASDSGSQSESYTHRVNTRAIAAHPVSAKIFSALVDRYGYADNKPKLIEEAQAWLVSKGGATQLGLTEEEAVDWLQGYWTSFAEENGPESIKRWQKITPAAAKVRDDVYKQQTTAAIPTRAAGRNERSKSDIDGNPLERRSRGDGSDASQVLRVRRTAGTREPAVEPQPSKALTTSKKLFVQIGKRRFPFESNENASARWAKARDIADIGSSETPRVLIVTEDGTEVGHISYNGKIWENGNTGDWQDDRLVYDPADAKPGAIEYPGMTRVGQTPRESHGQELSEPKQQTLFHKENRSDSSAELAQLFDGEQRVPPFYSRLYRAIEDRMPNRASADQVRALITSPRSGVKPDEAKWTGFDDWLSGRDTVTRAEALEFLKTNALELVESQYGGMSPDEKKYDDAHKALVNYLVERQNFDIHGARDYASRAAIEQLSDGQMKIARGIPEQSRLIKDLQAARTDRVDAAGRTPAQIAQLAGDANQAYVHAKTMFISSLSQYNMRGEARAATIVNQLFDNGYETGDIWDRVLDDATTEMADLAPKDDSAGIKAKFTEELNKLKELKDKKDQAHLELLASKRAGENKPARFENWRVPGEAENYRELVLSLPVSESSLPEGWRVKENSDGKFDLYNQHGSHYGTWATRDGAIKSQLRQSGSNAFVSGHWPDDVNVFAHTRPDERKTVDGKSMLFLNDVQSDWHQKGRDEGYIPRSLEGRIDAAKAKVKELKGPAAKALEAVDYLGFDREVDAFRAIADHADWLDRWDISDAEYQEPVAAWRDATVALKELTDQRVGVPEGPFSKNWHELVMRRMLYEAARDGKDYLGWITGEQAAEMFDLSKRIKRVTYEPVPWADASRGSSSTTPIDYTALHVESMQGQMLQEGIAERVNGAFYDEERQAAIVPNSKLADIVGKDLAQKIINGEGQSKAWLGKGYEQTREFSGLDLKVGGEGMKGFYDKIIPDYMRRLARKWGASIEDVEINPVQKQAVFKTKAEALQWIEDHPSEGGFELKEEKRTGVWSVREAESGTIPKTEVVTDKVHAITITPAMRQSVLFEGQPLFHRPPRVNPDAAFAKEFSTPDDDELASPEAVTGSPDEESPTFGSETGAINVDLLTLGVRPFAKELALKGIGATRGVADAADGIRSLLAPATRSPEARTTATSVRANAADMARTHDIAEKSLKAARRYFSKQAPQDNYDFIDRIERGEKQPNPLLQNFADVLRTLLDNRRRSIQELGTGKLASFIENYFPHIWKDPKKAVDAFRKVFAKRPLEGSKSFLKQRVLPYTKDGLAIGLEPASDNPVDLTLLKLREMDKYLMAHRVMAEMKERGTLRFFKVSKPIPDGWATINDKVGTVFSRSDKGELILRGRYAAPETAAKIINNYLSPGIEATAFRAPYKAWRATSNMLNQFQLGFSAFHAGFTTLDAMVSRTAVGLEDILRYGKPVRGLQTILSTPFSPVTNFMQGSKMLKEWYSPGSQGAEVGRLIEGMVNAGGRARMDRFYNNEASKSFMDTLRQWNIIGALLRLPGTAVELASKPIMEHLVPRQKMGIFAEMAKRELQRLGPDASRDEIRDAMARAWDSVDNRMGQLVYDNLFWNKLTKDLAMASVRSVGWNLGTYREVGGGILDFATVIRDITIGAPKVTYESPDGEPVVTERQRKRQFVFTHRMAYVIALPLVVGTIGALFQYLLTGKLPQELKDYFFPKTGEIDENGNPERVSLPSYMKDIFHMREDPGKTISAKLHPLFGLVGEMLSNEDYYGTKIRNEDDPLMQQVKDEVKHAVAAFTPFAVAGFRKERERSGSLKKSLLPFVGVTPAPSYLNKSEAEKLMAEKIKEMMPSGSRTTEEADRSKLRNTLLGRVRKGQDLTSEIDSLIQQGKLKPDDAKDIPKDAELSPTAIRFKRLPIKDALDVYTLMTPAERMEVRETLAKKAQSIDEQPLNLQDALRARVAAFGIEPLGKGGGMGVPHPPGPAHPPMPH